MLLSAKSSQVLFVATVLTVYGIETNINCFNVIALIIFKLQQCLPFTVLKHFHNRICLISDLNGVATVLTVYGIETFYINKFFKGIIIVATVLTVYGIETHKLGILL